MKISELVCEDLRKIYLQIFCWYWTRKIFIFQKAGWTPLTKPPSSFSILQNYTEIMKWFGGLPSFLICQILNPGLGFISSTVNTYTSGV